MPWEGTWNRDRTAFIGTFTGGDRVFMGAWTPTGTRLPDPPPGEPALSNDDPFFDGAPTNDRDAHQERWTGLWRDGIWRGKYKGPNDRFEFSGTMTLHAV
jgi:hypothetical protein